MCLPRDQEFGVTTLLRLASDVLIRAVIEGPVVLLTLLYFIVCYCTPYRWEYVL